MVRLDPCMLCSAPCCKDYTVTTTSFDVLRISKRSKIPAGKFARIVECTLLNKDPQTVIRLSDGDFPEGYMLIIKSHPCFFLDIHNKCIIHDYAPHSCTRYPFNIAGEMNARFCPALSKILFKIQGPMLPLEPYMKEINAYRELVQEWNDNPGRHHECLEWFLQKSAKWKF